MKYSQTLRSAHLSHRGLAVLAFAGLVAGCNPIGLPGTWSRSGLTYISTANDFSGMQSTAWADMPHTGSARFTGKYHNDSAAHPFRTDKGTATLDVDFLNRTVALNLTGAVTETAGGFFLGGGTGGYGTGFGSALTSGFNFSGSFYGPNANFAAGIFDGAGGDPYSQGSFITAR